MKDIAEIKYLMEKAYQVKERTGRNAYILANRDVPEQVKVFGMIPGLEVNDRWCQLWVTGETETADEVYHRYQQFLEIEYGVNG